jgi:hypothetical protein
MGSRGTGGNTRACFAGLRAAAAIGGGGGMSLSILELVVESDEEGETKEGAEREEAWQCDGNAQAIQSEQTNCTGNDMLKPR